MSARDDSAVEPAETGESPAVVDVVAPVAVDTAYSYRVPAGLSLKVGDLVDVPLGTRETLGVVWAVRQTAAGANLKPVTGKRDATALRPALMRFVEWVARWTLSPRGMALRMAIRAAEEIGPDPIRLGYRATAVVPERLTPARSRVLAVAADGFARSKSALAEAAASSGGVIDSLVDCGALEALALPPGAVAEPPDPDFAAPVLGPEQKQAADCAGGRRHRAQIFRDPPRRRNRLRQDGSLFRGRGGGDPRWWPSAHPDAGNRTDRAVS